MPVGSKGSGAWNAKHVSSLPLNVGLESNNVLTKPLFRQLGIESFTVPSGMTMGFDRAYQTSFVPLWHVSNASDEQETSKVYSS
jgi:hypothetical protein